MQKGEEDINEADEANEINEGQVGDDNIVNNSVANENADNFSEGEEGIYNYLN
jgi:hypothetical protein